MPKISASSDATKAVIRGLVPNPLSGRTAIVIGDSWATPDATSVARAICNNVNIHMKGYFYIKSAAGASGERLDQIQARFTTDVIDNAPDYCFIIGGLNDLVQNRTGVQMFASTQLMIDDAIDAGITPIVFPSNFGAVAWTGAGSEAATRLRIDALGIYHRLLSNYAIEKQGWIFLSGAYNGIVEFSANATYAAIAQQPVISARYSIWANAVNTDSNHPGSGGAFRIGKDAATELKKYIPQWETDCLPTFYLDRRSGAWNCLQKFTGTESSTGLASDAEVTNVPAEGWTARIFTAPGTAVITETARTDLTDASWTTNTVTALEQAGILELQESDPTEYAHFTHPHVLSEYGLVAGDIVQFQMEFKLHTITSGGTLNKISLSVYTNESDESLIETFYGNTNGGSNAEYYTDTDFSDEVLVITTPPYTIPAAMEFWFILLSVNNANNTDAINTNFTFELGRIGIRKVG